MAQHAALKTYSRLLKRIGEHRVHIVFEMTVLPMMKLVVESTTTSRPVRQAFFSIIASLLKTTSNEEKEVAKITKESQSLEEGTETGNLKYLFPLIFM